MCRQVDEHIDPLLTAIIGAFNIYRAHSHMTNELWIDVPPPTKSRNKNPGQDNKFKIMTPASQINQFIKEFSSTAKISEACYFRKAPVTPQNTDGIIVEVRT